MTTHEYYVDIVNDLNQELFDSDVKIAEEYCWSYNTSGFWDSISFNDTIIWDTDIDEREYNEETQAYEPLLPFIKKKFNEYVDTLTKIKFK